MAQSLADDFPIDPTTTTGTKLAEILNRFANAVNTSNSGGVPTETFAGMMWLDTSAGANGVLRMRNAANSGWLVMNDTANPPITAASLAPYATTASMTAADNLRVLKTGDTMTGPLQATRLAVNNGNFWIGPGGSGLVINWSASWYFDWNATTGALSWNAGPGGPQTIFFPNGNFQAAGRVNSSGAAGPSLRFDGGAANFLHMQGGSSGAWSWQWNVSNGALYWLGGAGEVLANFAPNGALSISGAFSAASVTATNINATNNLTASTSLSSPGRQYFGGQTDVSGALGINFTTGQTTMTIAQGDPSYGQSAALQIYHDPGQSAGMRMVMGSTQHQLRSDGTAYNNGDWFKFSDRRLKENIQPIRDAMAKLRRVTGYTFDQIDMRDYRGNPMSAAGLVAQEWLDVEPLTVKDSGNDEHHLAISAMGPLALLVNAVKELDSRLAQLEPA